MNFIVDSTIEQSVTNVKFGWPWSNRLDNSFEERHIISTLDRLETRSRRSLRCVAKRGQCRRKCSLSSVPVRHRHDELGQLKSVKSIKFFIERQLHDAIYLLRFHSKSLIHISSLSNSHNNVASIQKNRGDKSHRVIAALLWFGERHIAMETCFFTLIEISQITVL